MHYDFIEIRDDTINTKEKKTIIFINLKFVQVMIF